MFRRLQEYLLYAVYKRVIGPVVHVETGACPGTVLNSGKLAKLQTLRCRESQSPKASTMRTLSKRRVRHVWSREG